MSTSEVTTEPQGKIQFDDNSLLPALFGNHDEHLIQIEQLLDVRLRYRGNNLEILGPTTSCEIADKAIVSLYTRLKNDLEVGSGEAMVLGIYSYVHENVQLCLGRRIRRNI